MNIENLKCPTCGKLFYVPIGNRKSWIYKDASEKLTCSYKCSIQCQNVKKVNSIYEAAKKKIDKYEEKINNVCK